MKSISRILVSCLLLFSVTYSSYAGEKEIQELKNKLVKSEGLDRLEIINDLASEYLYTSFLLSEKYARLGLNEAIVQKDTIFQMRFYRKIGGVKQYITQYDSAVYYYQKSVDIAISVQDEYQEALSRLNIGNIYTYTDKYRKALDIFLTSVKALVAENDSSALSFTYNNIGTAYMSIDELDSAEFFLIKAIELKKQLNFKTSYGISLSNLGDVYLLKENYVQSEIEYKKALEIFEEENSTYNISYACIRLSDLYIKLGKLDLSEIYLHRSLELSEQVGSIQLKADAYKMLSEMFENQDKNDKALDFYKKYTALNDSIAANKFSGLLNEMNMVLEMEEQERELESLNNDIVLKESKITFLWSLVGVFIVLIIVVLLFYILNKRKNKILFRQSIKELQNPIEKESTEMDEKIEELYIALLNMFEKEKVYLDSALTTNKLSELLKSNNNYVSKCINLKFGDNFNAVVNMYRVKEAKLLMQDKQYANYTIAAISDMCGFTSLSVFNRSFKKETGITPSYFLKSIKETT